MPVLHDYHCAKHGYFESMEAKCPMKNCQDEVMMVFLQPPGVMSDGTKKNDKNLKQLAIDFNMSNIKSTREGEAQDGYFTRNNKTGNNAEPREPRPGDAAMWGNQAGWNMKNLLRGGVFRSVAGESVGVNPKDAGNLTGPKAASYIADHENLSIK